ncbi:MAG: PEP-CTERM sorting domain-containing protein [Desmonostoc vinosum HA7617-LM4]|nr:PEP-CTERM sorting domain-containing protein [Desmonostoc vinosum HA7617-LM4]
MATATVSIATCSVVVGNATPAVALDLTLSSVTGSWTNPVGGGSTVSGLNTNEIRWGEPFSNNLKSGLRFNGTAPPAIPITTETNFVLGRLTHLNFPIIPPILTGADLNIALDVGETQTFKYAFNVNETRNRPTCPSFQKSRTPCDDQINFTSALNSNTFSVEGQEYTLQLLGFSSTADGSNPVSDFITEERKASSAFLVGRITAVRTIPEPATVVGLSLLGLCLFNRRWRSPKQL